MQILRRIKSHYSWTKRFLIFAFLGLVVITLWSFVIEPSSLKVSTYNLALEQWPSEYSPLKIAVLTDLHVGAPYVTMKKLEEIVDQTNDSSPDLIVILGDLVVQGVKGGSFIPPEQISESLKKLKARLGTFAVLGNHDWWLDGGRVAKTLNNAGIRVLQDEAIRINNGGDEFWLVGFQDMITHPVNIPRALSKVSGNSPIFALTHSPDIFPQIPKRVVLTLAGHTHGGQVYLPFIGRPIVPSKYGEKYAAGHVVENDKHLFVSTGIGTSIFPVRFLVPPEVTVLNLTHEN